MTSLILKQLCCQYIDSTIVLKEFTKSTRLNYIQSCTKIISHEVNKDVINNSTLDEFLISNSAIFIIIIGVIMFLIKLTNYFFEKKNN